MRLANQEGPTTYQGHFEIVSLVGTLSVNGSHVHLSVSDSTGRTIGGHLLDGCKIYTTAELLIGVMPSLTYIREPDPTFGYRELVVRKKKKKKPGGGVFVLIIPNHQNPPPRLTKANLIPLAHLVANLGGSFVFFVA